MLKSGPRTENKKENILLESIINTCVGFRSYKLIIVNKTCKHEKQLILKYTIPTPWDIASEIWNWTPFEDI